MHTINYFANLRTPEEIKKRYFDLAKQHHPDHGGDVQTMQEINRQFADALQRAASGRAEGEEQQHARRECPTDFVAIIDKLIRLDGLTLEIVGSWLWISGATYAHREELKEAGCRWSSGKKSWYWHPHINDTDKRRGSRVSMDTLHTRFGSNIYASTGTARLNA